MTTNTGTLTITHTWHEGTTLTDTEKGSEAHRIAKHDRSWLWRPSDIAWGVRGSKRQRPKHHVINAMATALRNAGYEVEVELDEQVPSITEREQAEREQAERVTARHERAAHRHQENAVAEHAKADAVFDHIPFGQPILIGHHSEKGDRRRRERALNQRDRGYEQQAAASSRQEAARSSAAHMGARYSPETVGNRIEKLEAEQRDLLRRLDGGKPQWHHPHDGSEPWFGQGQPPTGEVRERIDGELARVQDDLAYWAEVRAQHVAEGKAVEPAAIEKGDWVRARHWWLPVRKVNKKSVTIPHPLSDWTVEPRKGEWTETTEFHKLRGHCKSADVPQEVLDHHEAQQRK